ncbi:MAG: hypothetical protein AAGF84_00745 [Planctomycetota bacterium]
MPTPDRPNRVKAPSENPPLPHLLDVIQSRRTQVIWIATVHVLVFALGLAVVWWATQSSGTQRAEASGWPTSNAWPTRDQPATGLPTPVRPDDATSIQAAPETTGRSPATSPDGTLPESVGETLSMAEATSAPAEAQAGLDVIPRVVEWPAGQGLVESIDDAPEASMAAESTTIQATVPNRLPPGGVRPVFEMPDSVVEWLMPSLSESADAWNQPVALTTGQVRTDTQVDTPLLVQASEPAAEQANAETANDPEALPVVAAEVEPEPVEPLVASPPPLPRDFTSGAFFGLTTGPRTVYLLDASGSLLDTLPFAIEELYRSVRTLDDRQQYAVVFFNGEGIVEASPGGMKPATRANLTQTLTWLEPRLANVRAKGRPDAADALAHALTLQPDTIILLSDGVTGLRDPAADRRKLVTLLERLGRGVRVHTIQFIDPDPLASRGRLGTLELLASLSGGRHRFVGLDQVAPQPRP